MILRPILALLMLSACTPFSETVGAAAPIGTVWVLQSINDQSTSIDATLAFHGGGAVRGTTPCNSFSAQQSAPLPWFEVDEVVVTKRRCTDAAGEQRFLVALQAMEFSEVAADNLLLYDYSTPRQSMFFKAKVAESAPTS